MFESKFFTVMIVLTLLAVLAIIGFQYAEMDSYGIISQLTAK